MKLKRKDKNYKSYRSFKGNQNKQLAYIHKRLGNLYKGRYNLVENGYLPNYLKHSLDQTNPDHKIIGYNFFVFPTDNDKIILSKLVSAAKSKFNINEIKEFHSMITDFMNKTEAHKENVKYLIYMIPAKQSDKLSAKQYYDTGGMSFATARANMRAASL